MAAGADDMVPPVKLFFRAPGPVSPLGIVMWKVIESESTETGISRLVCECGSLEIDYYFSGSIEQGELTLDVVCRGCLRTGSISLPSCGRQSGRVQ